MLTNNYQGLLDWMCTQTAPISAMYKTTTGTTARDGNNPVAIVKNTPKIQLGTGSTAPKRTDYVLESPIDESLYDFSFEYQRTQDFLNENSYSQFLISVTNKSSEQLTANECALCVGISSNWYVIAREVFDTPITLGVGETKSFVLKLF